MSDLQATLSTIKKLTNMLQIKMFGSEITDEKSRRSVEKSIEMLSKSVLVHQQILDNRVTLTTTYEPEKKKRKV